MQLFLSLVFCCIWFHVFNSITHNSDCSLEIRKEKKTLMLCNIVAYCEMITEYSKYFRYFYFLSKNFRNRTLVRFGSFVMLSIINHFMSDSYLMCWFLIFISIFSFLSSGFSDWIDCNLWVEVEIIHKSNRFFLHSKNVVDNIITEQTHTHTFTTHTETIQFSVI